MNARRSAYLGVLVAMAVALNVLERSLPSPLPWVRLGLANLLTLIAILTVGWRAGFVVTLLRVVIASLLFGGFFGPSFMLSLGGGLTATAVMSLMSRWVWVFYSPLAVSVAGAFAHGFAQVLVLRVVLVRTWEILYLLPWVLLPAVLSGVATGLLANLILLRRGKYLRFLGREAGFAEGGPDA
jgi:heptaprenyl diphosphate synthase